MTPEEELLLEIENRKSCLSIIRDTLKESIEIIEKARDDARKNYPKLFL